MTLKFYNTIKRKKEIFKPVDKGKVKMYVCGPTVYGFIHIGNARTFLTFDILYRYLKYKGFDVSYIQNITDVGHLTDVGEDKIMVGAQKKGMGVFDFVDLMIEEYKKDLDLLNIESPKFCRASDHIDDMIKVIKKLVKNGYAYESNGFVYYDISKFKEYGKLSGQDPEELKKKVEGEEHGSKKNRGDFALWIPAPGGYPMKWDSPWGTGFPGWHIECSTMSSKYLGLPFDIHGGGKDLIFPHHEDEIAQAEGATNKKFVNYWIHSEFIKIEDEKMSKSLGNIITARDAVEKYGWRVVRYFLISSHYRKELNFTEKEMENSKKALSKISDFILRLRQSKAESSYNKELADEINSLVDEFNKSMDDDLNVPKALSFLFKIINETNKAIDNSRISQKNIEEVLKTIEKLDKVLGLSLLEKKQLEISKEVKELIKRRENFRKQKDFKSADQIRDELEEKYNITLEDSPEGPKVKIKEN